MFKIYMTFLERGRLVTRQFLALSMSVHEGEVEILPAYDYNNPLGTYSQKELSKSIYPLRIDTTDGDEFIHTLVVDDKLLIEDGKFLHPYTEDIEKAKVLKNSRKKEELDKLAGDIENRYNKLGF